MTRPPQVKAKMLGESAATISPATARDSPMASARRQADGHADEPSGYHERAGDEREQRGGHLDIVEGGAQRAHEACRRKVHGRAVA